jgi:hypothetical protein
MRLTAVRDTGAQSYGRSAQLGLEVLVLERIVEAMRAVSSRPLGDDPIRFHNELLRQLAALGTFPSSIDCAPLAFVPRLRAKRNKAVVGADASDARRHATIQDCASALG